MFRISYLMLHKVFGEVRHSSFSGVFLLLMTHLLSAMRKEVDDDPPNIGVCQPTKTEVLYVPYLPRTQGDSSSHRVPFFWGGKMTKRGTSPKNVDKKGDTAFRRPRGFRCTYGRWHQSNGPAGCMRFHGTLFFTYPPSLY